jgi:hypothetical protein
LTGDCVYNHFTKGDPVWWIKAVGIIINESVELMTNVDDLLDKSIKERQHQWHVLYRGGFSIYR